MKNYNLKPLYIFLAIFATAWIVKLNISPKEAPGTKYHLEKNGKYVNSLDKEMHEMGENIKEEIKEGEKKDSILVIPFYKNN